MKKAFLLLIGLLVLGITSCASVEYKDDNNDDVKGIKTYSSKPYLLVERNYSQTKKGEENATKGEIKTTLISLPDIENPIYLKEKSGLGSSELSFTLENGMIKTYGSKADSKIPETITSVAGLISSLVGFGKTEPEEENDSSLKSNFDLYEIVLDKDNNKIKLIKVIVE